MINCIVERILKVTKEDPFTLDEESLKRYNNRLRKYLRNINNELTLLVDRDGMKNILRQEKRSKRQRPKEARIRQYENEIRNQKKSLKIKKYELEKLSKRL